MEYSELEFMIQVGEYFTTETFIEALKGEHPEGSLVYNINKKLDELLIKENNIQHYNFWN